LHIKTPGSVKITGLVEVVLDGDFTVLNEPVELIFLAIKYGRGLHRGSDWHWPWLCAHEALHASHDLQL
jgi:hypothetical protein